MSAAQTPGRLIAVVGPSGVGKDSVMAGLRARCPNIGLVERVITRDPAAGGEPFRPVTVAQFLHMQAEGGFCLSWGAHGLHYGIPTEVTARVAAGEELLVNLSRGALRDAQALVARFAVLHVTARPETLAARLAGRGRETAQDIAARLARATKPLPDGITAIPIENDSTLDAAVDQAIAALFPAVPARNEDRS